MKKKLLKSISIALSFAILATAIPASPVIAEETEVSAETVNEVTEESEDDISMDTAYGDPVSCTVNHYLNSVDAANLLESKVYNQTNTEGFVMLEGYDFTAPLSSAVNSSYFDFPTQQTITLAAGSNTVNYIYTAKATQQKASYTVHHQVYIPAFASSYQNGVFTEIKTDNVQDVVVGTTVTPAPLTAEQLDAALADSSIVKINNKSIKEALGYDASYFSLPTAKQISITTSGNELTYTYNKIKSKYTVRYWIETEFNDATAKVAGNSKAYSVYPTQPTNTTLYLRENATDLTMTGVPGTNLDTKTVTAPAKKDFLAPRIVSSSTTIGVNDDTVVDVFYDLVTKPAAPTYVDSTYTYESITYTLESTGNAIVKEYTQNAAGAITIPSTVTVKGMTYTVTSIADNAFKNNTNITSVVIPDTVTSIGSYAFHGCTNLSSVSIPNTVTTIGSYAFANSGLTSVTIPSSVLIIGEGAFSGCGNLQSITFANGSQLIEIASKFAYGCKSLKSITIPGSVLTIGSSAFEGCTSLVTVTFSSGSKLTSLGSRAFYGCALKKITIPSKVTKIGSAAFMNCKKLKTVTIKSKVLKTIGSKAFKNISKKATFKTQKSNRGKLHKKLSKKSVGYVKTWKLK